MFPSTFTILGQQRTAIWARTTAASACAAGLGCIGCLLIILSTGMLGICEGWFWLWFHVSILCISCDKCPEAHHFPSLHDGHFSCHVTSVFLVLQGFQHHLAPSTSSPLAWHCMPSSPSSPSVAQVGCGRALKTHPQAGSPRSIWRSPRCVCSVFSICHRSQHSSSSAQIAFCRAPSLVHLNLCAEQPNNACEFALACLFPLSHSCLQSIFFMFCVREPRLYHGAYNKLHGSFRMCKKTKKRHEQSREPVIGRETGGALP